MASNRVEGYRSNLFHVVIEEFDTLNNKRIEELDLNTYLKDELRILFYAFIKHDFDKDESGGNKHSHYHVVLVLKQAYSKNTVINAFASALLVNREVISCRKMNSVLGSIRYLIHKDSPDKFQYQLQDIWTNDLNEVNMCLYENRSSYDLDIDYLIGIVQHSTSLTSVYRLLGLERSKRYRSLISDLWKEEHPYGY